MRPNRFGLFVLFVGAIMAASPRALAGQAPILPTTPQLQEVVRLAQEGYGDSARAVVARIKIRTQTTDPIFPEVLFAAATVARTGEEMRNNFVKIVVDYPNSAWADKALLRLAQLDYGGGKYDGTIEKVHRFFTDYPNSNLLPSAALWGARAAFDRQQMQQACDWLTRGIAAAGSDVELKNQLEFAKQRCALNPGAEFAPVVPESLRVKSAPAARDTVTTRAPAPAKSPASPWRVQVAAIADRAAIARLVQQIERAGFTAYKVPGPRGLTKIQAGPFATREKAKAALPKVKAAVGGSPIVIAAPR